MQVKSESEVAQSCLEWGAIAFSDKCPYLWLFFFFFWLHLAAHGILIPQARIEPVPPASEAQSLNHWTAREVPLWLFKCYFTLFYF